MPPAFEIDDAVGLLVSAALPANGDAAEIIASAWPFLAMSQAFDRRTLVQPGAIDQHQLTLGVGHGFEGFQRHGGSLTTRL